jgi:hypothetical protein
MNKLLLLVIFLTTVASGAFAQTNATPPAKPVYPPTVPSTQLSIGGEFGFPAGAASSVYGSVLGASVKLEVPVSKSAFNVIVSAGYSFFLTKFNYPGIYKSALYVPIEVGGKYYFSKIGFVEGDLGLSENVNGNYPGEKTAFVYAPAIGFSAPTSKHKAAIDVSLRYEDRVGSGGAISQIALRLAYRFHI